MITSNHLAAIRYFWIDHPGPMHLNEDGKLDYEFLAIERWLRGEPIEEVKLHYDNLPKRFKRKSR